MAFRSGKSWFRYLRQGVLERIMEPYKKKKENVSTFDRTEPGGSVTVGAVLYSWYSMEAYKNLIFRAPGFSYLFNEPPYTTRRPNLEATLTGIEVSLISIAFIAPKVPSKCAYE